MRKLILALLVLPFVANADSIVISGAADPANDGEWEISLVTGDFLALQDQLEDQVWWGNSDLAELFAITLSDTMGRPNWPSSTNPTGPFFAFGSFPSLQIGISADFQVDGVLSFYPNAYPGNDFSGTWAIAERVDGGGTCELDASEFSESVAVTPAGKHMIASFLPRNGCTLEEVAEAMGYDHFNWVQVITHYDGLLLVSGIGPINLFTPFIDPPPGGYSSPWHPADGLPYYWDEGTPLLPPPLGWDPIYHLSNNIPSSNQLSFNDKPRSATIDPSDPNEHMAFTTSLVGVIRGDVWVPEFTFNWRSNFNGTTGGTSTARDLSPTEGGEGGIFDVEVLDDLSAVDPSVMDLWARNGGFESVPQFVSIDVMPDSSENCVNINDKGVVPVAALGSTDFDVFFVNQDTLLFGGLSPRIKGNGKPICSINDVNGDGHFDLQCQFEDIESNWVSNSGTALLRGELTDGTEFAGADSICIVP